MRQLTSWAVLAAMTAATGPAAAGIGAHQAPVFAESGVIAVQNQQERQNERREFRSETQAAQDEVQNERRERAREDRSADAERRNERLEFRLVLAFVGLAYIAVHALHLYLLSRWLRAQGKG